MNWISRAIACAVVSGVGVCPAGADAVIQWNKLLLDAIRNESTAPPLAARNLAIVHLAVFDAVNSILRTHEPYLMPAVPQPGASPEAAAVGAAYYTLAYLYPSQAASFDGALDAYLASTPATSNRLDGLAVGAEAALDLLAFRSADGSSTSVPYIPSDEPGEWRRTPPTFRPPDSPQWPYVIPFAMTNGAQFRPGGPPPLTSSEYARDLNLVKELGSATSSTRTAEQTLIARFWSDFSYTVTPPGHWNQIAQAVAASRGHTLEQNAHLFALLNLALADAAIVAWDAKYAFNFWRPITAIQTADLDGNSETLKDSSWQPLLNTPPFPEYISGHSTFSAAAAAVLGFFCDTDAVTFTASSDTLPGVTRTYHSFAEAADEIGMSRIFGGIHFLSADLDGLEAGRRLAQYVTGSFLRPFRPSLAIASPRGSSSIVLRVEGLRGERYQLEMSADLDHWVPVVTKEVPFTWDVGWEPGARMRLYRATHLNLLPGNAAQP